LYDEALGLLRGGGADGAEGDLKVFLTNHSFSHLGLFAEHFRDGDKILRFTRSARRGPAGADSANGHDST
jgi:hypothetical protein